MMGKLNGCIFLLKILEKYNTIWDKRSADIKKEFHSKHTYIKNFLETKKKSRGDEIQIFMIKKF